MRCEDWFDRLAVVIDKHEALPFEYGSSDCALIVFEAVAAITGEMPATFAACNYHDAASARTTLRDNGVDHLADLLALELDEIHPAFAGPGDVGICDYPGAIIGGGVIVVGLDVIGKGYNGTVRLPRSALSRAFRVK